MNSGKAFANTLIDTTAVVVLGAAIARAAPAVKGSKQEASKLDLEISHLWRGVIFLGISTTMVSALYHWDLLPLIK